jgi:hypothetical protein
MMPKVPDLLTSQSDSLGSGPSTPFGAANQLWTPDRDKKPPSLAEQRIMAVAEATRIRLMR